MKVWPCLGSPAHVASCHGQLPGERLPGYPFDPALPGTQEYSAHRHEQVRRFKDRLTNPRKRWKLSYEDFRNRDRWKQYEVAIEDMMEQTSTKRSRWYLVPANNKPYGRLAAFSILTDRLGQGVPLEPRPLDRKLAKAASRLLRVGPRA